MSAPPTVLIIEDDPVFRRVLSFTVAKAGLAVETASDGDEGWQRLLKGNVDFLVSDYQMPNCSGLQLLERLSDLRDYVRPPAILCTAKGLELDTEGLKERFQLAAIMHKPFSPRRLTELIQQSLGLSQDRGEQDCSTLDLANALGTQDQIDDPTGAPSAVFPEIEVPSSPLSGADENG